MPDFLKRHDGATLAYRRLAGGVPGVVFLHGFRSDMTGQKAVALADHCRAAGRACVVYDAFGHGASSGEFAEGTIGRWADDAVAVIDALTEGPQILVGSSMGGWLMLLAALRRPQRIAGLLGIAAAPDFTEDLMLPAFTDAERRRLEAEGAVVVPSSYGGAPYSITRRLIEEGREHLLMRGRIAIDRPVRLIHGLEDREVPWQTALRLQERLTSRDVEVTLVKSGGHRLSEPSDIARLLAILDGLAAQVA